MAKVEIYTKMFCPYCHRAKALLEAKGVEMEETQIDGGGTQKQAMIERSGGRMTVPQIFVNGEHVGGCDDLFRLEQTGQLDKILAA